MVTQVSASNFSSQGTTDLVSLARPPAITSIRLTDIRWDPIAPTYIMLGNPGYIEIVGSKFSTDCMVLIGDSPAPIVSFINSGLLRVTIQASMQPKTVPVYVVNGNGSIAIKPTGVTFA